MKFTLLSLSSGWLDAQIEHNGINIGICTSNVFGTDFPADLMTALYESISEKVTRMAGWTNENSDFGLLIEPLPDGTYKIASVYEIYWGPLAFSDPEQDAIYGREASKILEACRVHKGPVNSNPSLAVDTLGIVSEEEILDFVRSLLTEFTKFFGQKGQEYFRRHWMYGSDNLGGFIDELPNYEYMQLSLLIDQKTEEMRVG